MAKRLRAALPEAELNTKIWFPVAVTRVLEIVPRLALRRGRRHFGFR
jgi:hypothetical protein